jgi:cytochrome b subunit of formate dehydrogenase
MQRSRARLLITSVLFFAGALILALLVHLLLAMLGAVALVVMGVYFYTWATRAHGLWCRQCKRFPY